LSVFGPSREEARELFFETWRRYTRGEPLEPLQRTALASILLHPEYHALLDRPDQTRGRDYHPETGDLNPFLHLSLHLAVSEQLSIDQPPGIRAQFERLRTVLGDEHDALHAVLECLGETLWRAQRSGAPPDQAMYLECLRRRGPK
jgi:hypothetical protein